MALPALRKSEIVTAGMIFSLFIAAISSDIYLINTGDYHRVVFPFLEDIPSFQEDLTLLYDFKSPFLPLSVYSDLYISSYSYIVYLLAALASAFTQTFDLRLFSIIFKVAYAFSFILIFRSLLNYQPSRIVYFAFILACTPLLASSNLAFFESFYQEQLILYCLPLLIYFAFTANTNFYNWILATALALLIGACKSQFFYTPTLVLLFVPFLSERHKRIKFSTGLILAQIICVFILINSSSTTTPNRYHATYFGIYLWEKQHNLPLPDHVNNDCVGIDVWGNKFDKEQGMVPTDIGHACYQSVKPDFKDVITEVINHPQFLFTLPFDKSVKTQFDTNYFHVDKDIKIIKHPKGSLLHNITLTKDYLFKDTKLIISPFLIFCIAWLTRRKDISLAAIFTYLFMVSQFYISFLGEGYRDLSKHLFGMNFAFDIMLFFTIASLCIYVKQGFEKLKVRKHSDAIGPSR
ncbi:hypothetical protein MHM84_11660 [Halomonas sp. McH1-25]|uniref:hypothetical protein n=1 Tax=unclassified Halomonas TaxID=2609666 RepID=UPI001EF6D8E7|nr:MULTISPECIES: hypothetical protein [unclassified Halomonas]MCG7600449.1 hypothetical protein [Halomonas sp. McH1-25]MCP1344657.1 hypothetical protein [Halomonas sp. FL8]MCP1363176.1 hypothetical protein [Halomonas sp. BBD45]MCP1365760.1 hypothetical protein [Halomonas sp. BBD48]